MPGVGVRAASLLIFCRRRLLLQSDLPCRAADERFCDGRLTRRSLWPLFGAYPLFLDEFVCRAGLHHNLDRVIRAASNGFDDAPHLQGDARAARVNRLVRHVHVRGYAAFGRNRVDLRTLAELPRVFRCLASRSRFGTCLGQLVIQRMSLTLQLREFLSDFLHADEFIGFKQRHELLDRNRDVVQLCFKGGNAARVLFELHVVDAGGGDDVQVVHGAGKNEVLQVHIIEVPTIRTAVARVGGIAREIVRPWPDAVLSRLVYGGVVIAHGSAAD